MDLDEKVCSHNPFTPCLHTYAVKIYTFNQIYTYFIHFPWIYMQTELSWQFACKPLRSQLESQPLLSRRIQKQISNHQNNKTLLDISLLLIYWKHAFYFLIATDFYEFGALEICMGLFVSICSVWTNFEYRMPCQSLTIYTVVFCLLFDIWFPFLWFLHCT